MLIRSEGPENTTKLFQPRGSSNVTRSKSNIGKIKWLVAET